MANESKSQGSLEPDDREPPPERQAELEGAYETNMKARKPPYGGVKIATLGEVNWIYRKRGWRRGELPIGQAHFEEADFARAPLRGVNLRRAHIDRASFDGADLTAANLSDATMRGASFRKARLVDAHLGERGRLPVAALFEKTGDWISGVITALLTLAGAIGLVQILVGLVTGNLQLHDLVHAIVSSLPLSQFEAILLLIFAGILSFGFIFEIWAEISYRDFKRRHPNWAMQVRQTFPGPDFTEANLQQANLQYGFFTAASFRSTNLTNADLGNARLYNADLTGAHVAGANVGSATLSGAQVDSVSALSKMLLDSHTKIDDMTWNDTPRARTAQGRGRQARIALYRDESRVDRTIATALRHHGLYAQAGAYRVREQQAERRASLLDGEIGIFIGSCLLDWIAGYGERPGRIFVSYLIVIATWSELYFQFTNALPHAGSMPLQWYEAVVLSLSSFHGRGFFPQTIGLGNPAAIAAAIEAVVGLFIELLFIATFNRRFLGN